MFTTGALYIVVSRHGDDCWNFEVLMQIVEEEIQAREKAKGTIAAADTTPPARRSVRVNHTAATLLVGDGSSLPVCCYCE